MNRFKNPNKHPLYVIINYLFSYNCVPTCIQQKREKFSKMFNTYSH